MSKDIEEIAHRGYMSVNPENTISAIRNIINTDKYDEPDMIELDVQPSADNKIVVFHDEKLNNRDSITLTNDTGYIWEHKYEELKKDKILDTKEGIPQLKDILEETPDEISVNIELKDIDSEKISFNWYKDHKSLGKKLDEEKLAENKEIWKPFVEKVIAQSKQFENRIIISSFFEGAIAAAREIDSDIPLAFILYDSIEDGLEILEKYDCEYAHPPVDMILGTLFFNQQIYSTKEFKEIDIVDKCHSNGRKVNVWAIDNWLQVKEMKKAEVDGLITNYPIDILSK